jgi:hypothetical protein
VSDFWKKPAKIVTLHKKIIKSLKPGHPGRTGPYSQGNRSGMAETGFFMPGIPFSALRFLRNTGYVTEG